MVFLKILYIYKYQKNGVLFAIAKYLHFLELSTLDFESL